MAKRKPLIDEEGEVRELTLEDFKLFRPVAEVLSPELLAKIKLYQRGKRKSADGTKPTRKAVRSPKMGKE